MRERVSEWVCGWVVAKQSRGVIDRSNCLCRHLQTCREAQNVQLSATIVTERASCTKLSMRSMTHAAQ